MDGEMTTSTQTTETAATTSAGTSTGAAGQAAGTETGIRRKHLLLRNFLTVFSVPSRRKGTWSRRKGC
mgnify:CR=1 FL=1